MLRLLQLLLFLMFLIGGTACIDKKSHIVKKTPLPGVSEINGDVDDPEGNDDQQKETQSVDPRSLLSWEQIAQGQETQAVADNLTLPLELRSETGLIFHVTWKAASRTADYPNYFSIEQPDNSDGLKERVGKITKPQYGNKIQITLTASIFGQNTQIDKEFPFTLETTSKNDAIRDKIQEFLIAENFIFSYDLSTLDQLSPEILTTSRSLPLSESISVAGEPVLVNFVWNIHDGNDDYVNISNGLANIDRPILGDHIPFVLKAICSWGDGENIIFYRKFAIAPFSEEQKIATFEDVIEDLTWNHITDSSVDELTKGTTLNLNNNVETDIGTINFGSWIVSRSGNFAVINNEPELSANLEIIDHPVYGSTEEIATLTVTMTWENISRTSQFDFTIVPENANDFMNRTKNLVSDSEIWDEIKGKNGMNSPLFFQLNLDEIGHLSPITHFAESGGRLFWRSSNGFLPLEGNKAIPSPIRHNETIPQVQLSVFMETAGQELKLAEFNKSLGRIPQINLQKNEQIPNHGCGGSLAISNIKINSIENRAYQDVSYNLLNADIRMSATLKGTQLDQRQEGRTRIMCRWRWTASIALEGHFNHINAQSSFVDLNIVSFSEDKSKREWQANVSKCNQNFSLSNLNKRIEVTDIDMHRNLDSSSLNYQSTCNWN